MKITRFGTIAAVTATAALLLTACGGGTTEDKAADKAADKGAAPSAAQEAAPSAASEFDFLSGTAKQNKAQPKTGDWANAPRTPQKWVQLSAALAGALDPVVVNGAGFTLYRFDNDTANPSKSTCNDACATTWPPVVVKPGGRIFIDGVRKSDVGVVKRDDGNLQVTVGGWPVYRFNKDLRPGDTNGQGVGGTWFGVTPDGRKAGGATAPAGGNSSVTLSDETNFGDPSEGLAGSGCQNVGRDNRASSLQASGTVKIWTEKDCKGTSKSVSGNVADLASIGFDNTVSSVRFG
ncbi:hypothetical protein Q5762_30745 [Streptomyces sp. P9(2023)]|uniref:COG4315 family predicted lipoprotein n=1 Tax=Streptomyces sp. P9(2023) TaxID=3064394 RepID=UPI0028F4375E|nr:hypothetical protein [Streptomyces sp. P9(2023)]MDT9692633.1 hypothetical protein [Streptomyces sp. P9(2023)]